MPKKFYQTTEFKQLSKDWEKRLEEEGLGSVEKTVGTGLALRQNSSNVYRQMDPVRREAKETYFRRLSQCLQTAAFDSGVDRIVMVLRAQGTKIVEICTHLAKMGMRRYRRTVRLIVRKYEHRWRVRTWKPEQLVYRWKPKQPIR